MTTVNVHPQRTVRRIIHDGYQSKNIKAYIYLL